MMTAKLFENGRSQAVRLPKECRFNGDEVAINKIGEAVERNRVAITLFLSSISILPFDNYAAEEYGKVRADLERKGTPIGPMDMLIAGHARSEGLILATNNTRKFFRVEDLEVEDWTRE